MHSPSITSLFRAFLRRRKTQLITVRTRDGRAWPVYHITPLANPDQYGVPIVLLHGFWNDEPTWLPFLSTVGMLREVAIPVLPGFLHHPLRNDEWPTPLWYASVVSELLQELTARWGQPPIVIGKSIGGTVAGLVAARLPHLVRKVLLICPAGIETETETAFWRSYRAGENPLIPATRAQWDTMVSILYHTPPEVSEREIRSRIAQIAQQRPTYLRISGALLADGEDVLGERIADIGCSLTAVWGRNDRVMAPAGLERILRLRPDAEVYRLSGCGHVPTQERPRELRQILLRVLSRWG